MVQQARAQVQDAAQASVRHEVAIQACPVRGPEQVAVRTAAHEDASDQDLPPRRRPRGQGAAERADDAVNHRQPAVANLLHGGIGAADLERPWRSLRDGRQGGSRIASAQVTQNGWSVGHKQPPGARRDRASLAGVDDEHLAGSDALVHPERVDAPRHRPLAVTEDGRDDQPGPREATDERVGLTPWPHQEHGLHHHGPGPRACAGTDAGGATANGGIEADDGVPPGPRSDRSPAACRPRRGPPPRGRRG